MWVEEGGHTGEQNMGKWGVSSTRLRADGRELIDMSFVRPELAVNRGTAANMWLLCSWAEGRDRGRDS